MVSTPATILVVDDEPEIRDMLSHALQRAHYAVETAADASAALSRLDDDVDLVLLDLMLPGLDGLELCRRVRAAEGDAHLPIIMLTGLGSSAQRHAGFEAGADDYMVKPFELRELLDRIQVWVHAGQRFRTSRDVVGGAAVAGAPPAQSPRLTDAILQFDGLLHHLVDEATRRPGFLAAALVPYARAQGWNEEDLAAALGCPLATLSRLLLRPRPLPMTWDADVTAIAEACGAERAAVARTLAAVEEWERAHTSAE